MAKKAVGKRELMGWVRSKKKWQKRYRGKLYFRSPRQLGTEATKEASRTAANDWWTSKQAEIDEELGRAKRHPLKVAKHYEEAINHHSLYARWHRRYGHLEEATKSEQQIELLQSLLQSSDQPPFPLPKVTYNPLEGLRRDFNTEDVLTFDLLWRDRYINLQKEEQQEQATPEENTIRNHLDQYLKLYRSRKLAEGKLGSWNSLANWLRPFREWVSPNSPLEDLSGKSGAELWEKYFIHLAKQVEQGRWTSTTAKNYQNAARMFVRSRLEKGLIDYPYNLTSRNLTFTAKQSEPETYTKEALKTYLTTADERLRLYMLLCLNCGMYTSDIGKLAQSEVLDNGRIKRKRTKTRDRSKNVPLVDFPLWPETLELLQKFRSKDKDFVFLNDEGLPLWREVENDDKFVRLDNIKSMFFRLQRDKLELSKEDRKDWRALRKTGASEMEQSKYGRFSEHYLGEAPKNITSRHYVHKNGAEFDEAVNWLRKQLGIDKMKF